MAGSTTVAGKYEKRASETGRGREAETPTQIPAKGWLDIGWRIYSSVMEDRILLIAAGATFYLLLALFPALAAFVSVYGFVADPRTVADQVAYLGAMLPQGSIDMIQAQLQALTTQETSSLSLSFIFGLGIALWSANNGVKALFEAMNVAYREEETRSFIRVNLVSFMFTLGAIVIGILMITMVGVVPALLAFLHIDSWTETIVKVLRWPVIFLFIGTGITLIYRYGADREPAKLRWLTWGAGFSTIVWLVTSILFSWYLENFADYNATYGTLGAVIGFMTWTWISCIILIVGAEINGEMEHQTVMDTTTGEPKPMGTRGAVMADTVGVASDEKPTT
ncbi:YihY/virulence factor BrkB family protein [Tianweitania sp. BSSL-BM11]|uniref:YihY/virulence factor BrkB family protein n=1 Tax=Tianweitania aestuarii TaxID=2814886 RepID=A0ABS5RYP6_9HYPH|nr:YihY/virulence factor BrkB family protein [Tianweitania aestuarii]MBS9721895.1 YihY/virulence factor BrkB family protein [Tianweitania aestuarii]